MPKTRKEKQNKKEKTEKDLEKEWKKLREKIKINLKEKEKALKQEIKEEKDESELEEEIEESEIPKEQFQELQDFVPTIEIPRVRAPVIERIERREIPQETLEKNIASTPTSNVQEQNIGRYDNVERGMGYSALTTQSEERRYEPEPVILRPVREKREFSEFRRQEFLSPFEEERDWEDKIIDMSEARLKEDRRLPFETEKKKYKEYKSEKLST